MKKTVFTVQDTLAKVFNAPFTMNNEEVGKRAYTEALKTDPFSGDKRLFVIGTFDDELGTIEPCTPYQVMGGIQHE